MRRLHLVDAMQAIVEVLVSLARRDLFSIARSQGPAPFAENVWIIFEFHCYPARDRRGHTTSTGHWFAQQSAQALLAILRQRFSLGGARQRRSTATPDASETRTRLPALLPCWQPRHLHAQSARSRLERPSTQGGRARRPAEQHDRQRRPLTMPGASLRAGAWVAVRGSLMLLTSHQIFTHGITPPSWRPNFSMSTVITAADRRSLTSTNASSPAPV